MSNIELWVLTSSYDKFLWGCTIITAIVVFVLMKLFGNEKKIIADQKGKPSHKFFFGVKGIKFFALYLIITILISVAVMIIVSKEIGYYLLMKPLFYIFFGIGIGVGIYMAIIEYKLSCEDKSNLPF
ncbi:MAG: hypothetical protein RR313_09675 [Anaerovoracaceae bacterium]